MSIIDKIIKMPSMQIRAVAFQKCAPSWHWQHSGASFIGYHYWYVINGEAHLKCQWGEFRFVPGAFMIMPMGPNIAYHGTFGPSKRFDVHFGLLETVPYAAEEPWEYLDHIGDHTMLRALFERLSSAQEGAQQLLWLRAAFAELTSCAKLKTTEVPEQIAIRLKRKFDRSIGERHSLKKLAEEMNLGEDYLIRAFRKYHGITPRQYEIERRMEQAAGLLRLGGLSIDEIAMQLGYTDRFTFSRQFKKFYGASPGSFHHSLEKHRPESA